MNISAVAANLAPDAAGPLRTPDRSPAAERQQVAAQFEAILVRQLLSKSLTSMLGSENSAATGVYGDLLTDRLAQQLTAGPGLGLGRVIASQLTPRGTPVADPVPPLPHS